MKIRREINLLNSLLTCASGAEVTSTNYTPIVPVVGSNSTYYFEIIARSSSSITFNVGLRRVGIFSNETTITVPTSTTTYTRFRSAPFTAFVTSPYNAQVHISNASGATKDVIAARIVAIQDAPVASMEMFEIGSENLAKTNTASAALTNPKYWLYTAANYDGTLAFEVSVRWLTSSTKNNCTITLQEDDGSFGGWTNVATIVNAASSTAITSSSASFTPTDGRNYRIASLGSTTKSSYSIYSAKIRVQQSSVATTELAETKPIFSDASLLAYYKLEDLIDSFGSNDLTNTGSVSFTSGKFNNAADFGSSVDHGHRLYVNTDFGLDVDTEDFSVSLWVKSNVALSTSRNSIIAITNTDGKGATLRFNGTTDRLEVQTSSSPFPFSTTAPSTIDDGNWHHIVFGCLAGVNGSAKFYFDGVDISDDGSWGTFGTGAAGPNTVIGNSRLTGSSSGFAGIIDDVLIFNKRLSTEEVYQLYYEGLLKFECQMLLANKIFAAGTSLQDYDTLYDPAEWEDANVNFFHEVNSVAAGTSDIKLQDTSGPTDVTGSTVTDAIERERTAAMTMPGSSATLDCIATSNGSNIYASRIIAIVSGQFFDAALQAAFRNIEQPYFSKMLIAPSGQKNNIRIP